MGTVSQTNERPPCPPTLRYIRVGVCLTLMFYELTEGTTGFQGFIQLAFLNLTSTWKIQVKCLSPLSRRFG